jgi:hypothetical protein
MTQRVWACTVGAVLPGRLSAFLAVTQDVDAWRFVNDRVVPVVRQLHKDGFTIAILTCVLCTSPTRFVNDRDGIEYPLCVRCTASTVCAVCAHGLTRSNQCDIWEDLQGEASLAFQARPDAVVVQVRGTGSRRVCRRSMPCVHPTRRVDGLPTPPHACCS